MKERQNEKQNKTKIDSGFNARELILNVFIESGKHEPPTCYSDFRMAMGLILYG